jgi:LCP family protein required for cell wall assembly
LPSRATVLTNLRNGMGRFRALGRRLVAVFAVPESDAASGKRRSPSIAAILSFVWPGLGQLYLRSRRTAVIFAIPPILLVLLLAYALRRGTLVLATQLVADRLVGLTAVTLLAILGLWRLASVLHAFLASRSRTGRRIVQRGVLGALVLAILGTHLAIGAVLLSVSNAGSEVFNPVNPVIARAAASYSLAPGATATAVVTPGPTPDLSHRITVMLSGVDASPEPNRLGEMLYDSMMVISFDPTTNSVQMISVPRDATNFPLYYGGVRQYPHKLNELPSDVRSGFYSPETNSDPEAKGYATIVNEVQYLLGVHIDYTAKMDLDQFVSLIDTVGGIWVDNPTAICDCAYTDSQGNSWPGYDWLDGTYGFQLPAGHVHLDGRHALAYIRSRHSIGESDWTRQNRQQQVLLALLKQMTSLDQLPNLFKVINDLPNLMLTDLPGNLASDLVAVYTQNNPKVNQVVLDGQYFRGYIGGASCLNYYRIAQLSRQVFGKDSLWQGKPDPPDTCPA